MPLTNSWGMTELGPIGTVARGSQHRGEAPRRDELSALARPGYPAPLVRLRVSDSLLPGNAGELEVSGPTVAKGYLGGVGTHRFSKDGWLRTGDAAEFNRSGLTIKDRLKDVIKSGGEWISSVDLENLIMEHPAIAEVAVVATAHEHWDERPVAFVVLRRGAEVTREELVNHLRPRVAKFWIPDRFIITDALPRTSTGKISKLELRERYAERESLSS